MLQQLQAILRPVRFRQRCDRGLRWGAWGVTAGAAIGSLALIARWVGVPLSVTHALSALLLGGAGAAVAGLLWPTSWRASARLVDAAYQLKDRTLTALDFASRGDADPLRELQLRDALSHIEAIDPKQAAPLRAPRMAPAAGAATLVMLTLLLVAFPPTLTQANLPTGPLEIVTDQALLLEETLLEELNELVEETEDPELEALAEEMKEAVNALKEPDVDQHDALAQLSEMQAALTAARANLQTQQVDAELQKLAEALQDADATQAASQALAAAEYDKAATELEKIDASTMSRKQRDAVAANLAKLSKNLGEGRKGQLSESIQEMVDGLESNKSSQCKSGFCKAAGVCRKQSVRKKIAECLACQLNRLAECKGCCQGQCNKPGSKVAKSDSPSKNAGRGASGQPTGEDKTNLDSRRREEDLTGIAGEGPSERETTSTADARQDAARTYQERYTEYRKQMEEVLDSEPLPLGHRETVRKYFESIRPNGEEQSL